MSIRVKIFTAIAALTLVAVLAPVSTAVAYTGIPAGFTFTRNLPVGTVHADVVKLKVVLIAEGCGVGISNTTYYGPNTKANVQCFQNKYKSAISAFAGYTIAATGLVGTGTRAQLNVLIGGTVVPPVGTGLNAALAVDNPASGVLVLGQGLTALAKFQFTGTDTISTITLKRIGVSADTTLSNVYLFDGSTRLTDAASVSGGSLITFAGLNIAVSGSKVITVKSTIAGAAGELVGVQLTAVTVSSGIVNGLPISSNLQTISSASLATVAVGTALPSTTATTDPQSDVRIWESTVAIGVRDVAFTRLALRQINSIASADINNFRLFVDGVQVAQVQSLDADKYVTFNFSKTLTTGNRNVKVLADVIGGSSFYIQMSLRTAADIEVSDSQYGVNVLATGIPATITSDFKVNSGTMTVEKATDSPTGNITNAASDVALGRWTFKANGEPIKVETLVVDFAYDGSPAGDNNAAARLRNGRVLVNGVQVGSTTTLDPLGDPTGYPANSGTLFATNFIVTPGSPATVEVRADVYDADGSTEVIDTGDTITVSLTQGVSNAEKRVSLGRLLVPSAAEGNVSANQVTVAQGTMALALQSNYANQNTVVPQTAYKLAAYNLTGNSTEDINIYTISVDFGVVSGSTFAYDDLSNVYVKYGTSSVTTTKSGVDAASNSWSVSNFTLAKNATVLVEIYATIGSTITTTDSIKARTTITGLTASSGQTATAAATYGQTISKATGSFTATKDASSVVTAIVADNATINAAAFKFTAVNDTYKITKLTFTINAGGATVVRNVMLKDGGTVLATLPGAATVVFNLPTSGTGSVTVGTTPKVLTVALELGTVGVGAGTSGSNITVTLVDTSVNNRAIASSTGVEGNIIVSTVVGSTLYAYASVPTITNVALPTSVLSIGSNTLAKFQVSSSGTGTVGWKKVILNVLKTAGPTIANNAVKLYDADSNTEIACSTEAASGLSSTDLLGTITFVTTAEQEVSGAKTYVVKATVGTAVVANDYISTSIPAQSTTYVAPAAYANAAGVNGGGTSVLASLVWTDQSAESHGVLTLDWNNELLVRSLPLDSQTLSK